MGDVDINKLPPVRIQQLTGVEPLHIQELAGVEPLRIGQIAPAAVHIKELNHIDPISVESLRIDEIRNLEPVRIERFDVTRLPTVNLSMSRFPSLAVLSIRNTQIDDSGIEILLSIANLLPWPSSARMPSSSIVTFLPSFSLSSTTPLLPSSNSK